MSNINNDQGVLTYLNAVGGIGASMGASGGRSASSSGDSHSWFKAMADAWGRTMDAQANRITELSDAIGTGGDQPAVGPAQGGPDAAERGADQRAQRTADHADPRRRAPAE
mgnify:CR=1 FL=1